ncbi:GSCFA domain-containing protein [Pseudoduganella lutea]|nr:GSCFA domain-containing protein [Pseudoduganella lutea]
MMHPYSNLPDRNFWNRFVAKTPWRDLQLCGTPKFMIRRSDRIATAGSCFAQHIARYLNHAGCGRYLAEQPHPLAVAHGGETASYELFTARYGNIYTARQALELFRQAFGQMPVIDDYAEHDGRWYDLMRPNAVPDGFATRDEARHDRRFHLACVRTMFTTAEVFVFTLGLTESWYHAAGGHTYPACPGTAKGVFDPAIHLFRNLTCAEVESDLDALVQAVRGVNLAVKIILTVSPVPLVATYTNDNVLVASSYSKSVLRAAVGAVEPRYDYVQYFPSYEIISHAASFGQYLASDLRDVAQRGVEHVMGSLIATLLSPDDGTAVAAAPAQPAFDPAADTARFIQAECEEIYNEAPR